MFKIQVGVEKVFRWEELEDVVWMLTPSHLRRGVSVKIPEAKGREIELNQPAPRKLAKEIGAGGFRDEQE